jgi:hypothetical protein
LTKDEASPKLQRADRNSDNYPTAKAGLSRLVDEGYFESTHIDRLEVHFLANGEVTYRYWAPRAEESEGGVLEAPK